MHLKMRGCQRKNCSHRWRRCYVSCHTTMPDQTSTLTFAATDTTSSALTRFLYLLSAYQDVQSKLREEIVGARSRYGYLNYDELVALPYLDAICRETLRL